MGYFAVLVRSREKTRFVVSPSITMLWGQAFLGFWLVSGLPIGQKFLQTAISQRMFDQLLKDGIGHRANMSPGQRGFYDMLRVADAGDQDLRGKRIIFIDRENLPDQFHPIRADIIQATDER